MATGEDNPDKSFASPDQVTDKSFASPDQVKTTSTIKKLKSVLDRFEITIAEANDLVVLQDYNIILIADDSGSMAQAAEPAKIRNVLDEVKTRWDELKMTIGEVVEICTCFDSDGVDVYFLNRPPVLKVTRASDAAFIAAFSRGPFGGTPLTQTVTRIKDLVSGHERKHLIIIFTDGEPNGGAEHFKQSLQALVADGKVRVQIMVCTPEEDEIKWLNDFDKKMTSVDVTDDYNAEKKQVLQAGRVQTFTRGDWCLKALLGPVSSKFDDWDEKPKSKVSCCIIL